MLSRLSIQNYALIDSLDIHFDKGLNILTGETGAGKSIIMGGLSLILGQRIESRYFFNQEKKCIIEGYFDVSGYQLEAFFEEQDLDYDGETIMRREISVDGKSRAFVNDTPVTLNVLKMLAEKLIDIHSQHATLQLNTESFQLFTLDSIAQNQPLRLQYVAAYRTYKTTVERLNTLKANAKQAGTEADYQQFLFDELANAKLEPGEQEQLEIEQQQLEHAEEIKRNLFGAAHVLQEQEINAVVLLKEALSQLQQAERHMPSLSAQVERLQSAFIEIKDLGTEIGRIEQDITLDEERLATISERLDLLYTLQQKHRVDNVEGLVALREELGRKLAALSSDDEEIVRLEVEVSRLKAEMLTLADQLSASRRAVIPHVQDEVSAVLRTVGMPNSQLYIVLDLFEEESVRASGRDRIEFRFTANKGQDPQPVGKVASGGELSRLMLAIKSLIAKTSALPTIIFDEIDTGISGEVALKVGEIMERLADHMQVIAITHLPQIASKGNTHFKVYKIESVDKTATTITQLAQPERIQEIAEMLSGTNPGEAAVQHAAELLGK
ncbi:DNA repair protein RecN [Parapedobacter indicus]|uniref:DNA repair protein RecN n=1 Tax=Parapedobacter indicus TaxID=1477437 RepID=A0A1I3CFP1_9SPHI|nr:DNA repair protein RecN [Parapedobacter indicus]PPL04229.1 DNA replication and repair protein RecN [Parapedobacter indicus]SFH73332.1 DNA replication and repair protein RecN [Parapedobacter indicus]